MDHGPEHRNLPRVGVSVGTMPPFRKLLPITLVCVVALAFVAAAPALASHSQPVYFEGSTTLLNAKTRPKAIAQMQHLGVKALRIELYWIDVAPGATSATKPGGPETLTNPGLYSWGAYDTLIAEAQRLHWKVLLTPTSPVPRWATSNKKAPYVTKPDPADFREFMTAVARHYGPSGPFGSTVSLFSIWNEPNHPAFLLPQWNTNGTPASPRIYRALYQAGYEGLKAGGIAKPQVLLGETAPTGYTRVNYRREKSRALLHDVAPLAFLRGALCLNAKYRKSSSCTPLTAAGYAHHAYSTAAGPLYKPPEKDDVTIGVLSRLSSALGKAYAARAVTSRLPIYLTEFGVQSKPNRYLGVPAGQQAEYDAIAEKIAWNNRDVAAFSQYLLVDDPLGGKPGASVNGGTIGFQTGLEYLGGKPKPLYYAWPIPLVVSRSRHGYSLWGLVRPSEGATKVTVLIQPKGSHRYRRLATVTTNRLGYWTLHSSRKGAHWRVRWVSPTHVKYEGPPTGAH
jgi:hypothetical protein